MKKPYVTIISEMTVDGKLSLDKGISSKILMTGMDQESKLFLHKLRADYDAIMVGSNTIKIDDSNLTVRYVKGKNPLRVIPCSDADIPLNANIFNNEAPTLLCVSNKAPNDKVEEIKKKSCEVVKFDKNGHIDLVKLMDYLYNEKKVKKLILEGGPTLSYHMIKNKLVDHIIIINMPLIVGGEKAPSLVGGIPAKDMNDIINVKLTKHYLVGKHLITEYDIIYK